MALHEGIATEPTTSGQDGRETMKSGRTKARTPSRISRFVTLLGVLAIAGAFIAGAMAATACPTCTQKKIVRPAKTWSITGNVDSSLYPGTAPIQLDLSVSNPHKYRLTVTKLTAVVRSVKAPHATRALPCTKADFAVRDYTGRRFTVPSGVSTLQRDRVPRRQWPAVWMLNRPVDQDGCKGATLNLAYDGVAVKSTGER